MLFQIVHYISFMITLLIVLAFQNYSILRIDLCIGLDNRNYTVQHIERSDLTLKVDLTLQADLLPM